MLRGSSTCSLKTIHEFHETRWAKKTCRCSPKENRDLIEAAFKKGGNKNYTVLLLPGLNQLLQTAKTGLPAEYGEIEETIAPIVLQTMSDWILKQTQQHIQQSSQ